MVSLAFPQSTTKTTSLIVILASAIFVASTILRTFGGGFSNMSFCINVIKDCNTVINDNNEGTRIEVVPAQKLPWNHDMSAVEPC